MLTLQLPAKSAAASTSNTRALSDGLTSVIWCHSGATEPWTFYEVLDEYLGPWRENGYPIAYGRYYCMAFNQNEKLRDNPRTREWLRKTTIYLQETLRDFVVNRFRMGTLNSLSEAELRTFAFSVHPRAYVQGGLTMVVLTAPELVPIIVSIPAAQFIPTSDNFGPSVKEVLATMELVLPQATGMVLAGLAGPAHTGIISRAAQLDEQDYRRELATGRWLADTLRRIQGGELDNFVVLDRLTTRLNNTQFGDQSTAQSARQVVQAAGDRKHALARYYRDELRKNPRIAPQIDRLCPGWRTW